MLGLPPRRAKTSQRWPAEELARGELEIGIDPLDCPECGLLLPGPHRGVCSVSLMRGGPGYGLPKRRVRTD